MRWILLALLCGWALGAQAEDIWRWVDENGVVHYSDRPRPGAEKIELRGAQTYQAPAVPPSRDEAPEETDEDAATGYTDLRLVSPADGETLWNIGGELPVQVAVEPSLAPSHRLRVYLDGRLREDSPQATQFTLPEVYRGEHQLRAAIVDGQGREVASTAEITFYVQQASLQNPNRSRN